MKAALFMLLQHLLPQHLLSRTAGLLADCETPWFKNVLIRLFARRFQVNMAEAAEPQLESYPSFNAFFTRPLAAGARPVHPAPDGVVCPADGAISQLGAIDGDQLLQAKGRYYSVAELLADAERAKAFENGRFATIYLAPRDYHRVHMPVAGTLTGQTYLPGGLFSVNPVTTASRDRLFARNERLVCHFDTQAGAMALVMVGAMIVGGIETVWQSGAAGSLSAGSPPVWKAQIQNGAAGSLSDLGSRSGGDGKPPQPVRLDKGAEMGRFKLGSTVILLFPEGAVEWEGHYRADSPTRMGELLGRMASS